MREEKAVVSAKVPVSIIAEIERIAKKRGLTKSETIKMLLDIGAQCHSDMEKIGVIGVVDAVYYLKEAIKEKSKGKQLKLNF